MKYCKLHGLTVSRGNFGQKEEESQQNKWKKTGIPADKDLYHQLRHVTTQMAKQKKKEHLSRIIDSSEATPKHSIK